jgi:site-specific DNA recombinase
VPSVAEIVMLPKTRPSAKRCAIYTRKSRVAGLDQAFNSLDHQRAACSAYIVSQGHKGWTELPDNYEDAAFSGATLERPALQQLLQDVERGHVDVIVLYKLDRISRSLLDFVRLLDVFDRHSVTFVCITQNFDTSDSLGRLVMNVLLTFAQFEREITSDRIKDKLVALAQRGVWIGARPPFGYDRIDHKLVVNEAEASVVKWMFERYRELRSLDKLWSECRERGYQSKTWVSAKGRVSPGRLMPHASVRSILMNCVHAGMINHKGRQYSGRHQPIVSKELWSEVQSIRIENGQPNAAPIVDLLPKLVWDSTGRLMSVHRSYKKTGLCRYYISRPDKWDKPSVRKRARAKANELEALVLAALQELLSDKHKVRSILLDIGRNGPDLDLVSKRGPGAAWRLIAASREHLAQILRALLVRVELSTDRVKIVTRSSEVVRFLEWDGIAIFKKRGNGN